MNPFYYLPIALGLFIIIKIFFVVVGGRRRRKAFQEIADSLHLTYLPDGDEALISSFAQMPLLASDRGNRAFNVLQGNFQGVEVTVVDWESTSGSGENSTTRVETVLQLRSSDLQLPNFTLRPQNWIHGIAVGLGLPDINFDSHPRFSKQSLLNGMNEEQIRRVFTPRVLEFFEEHPTWQAGGNQDRFLFGVSSKKLAPKEIRDYINEGLNLLNRFKSSSMFVQ